MEKNAILSLIIMSMIFGVISSRLYSYGYDKGFNEGYFVGYFNAEIELGTPIPYDTSIGINESKIEFYVDIFWFSDLKVQIYDEKIDGFNITVNGIELNWSFVYIDVDKDIYEYEYNIYESCNSDYNTVIINNPDRIDFYLVTGTFYVYGCDSGV